MIRDSDLDGEREAVAALAAVPDVRAGIDRARDACTTLRWHEALRRRGAAAAAESRVRGARASALLDGADVGLDRVRDLVRGAVAWPDEPDGVTRTLRAAVQVTAEAEHARGVLGAAPRQGLARLHVAAGSPLLDPERVGRPRQRDEQVRELVDLGPAPLADGLAERLGGVARLLSLDESAPAIVVAGLVHAELATCRPFAAANALVARAAERAWLQKSGVDPTGVAVPEVGHHARGSSGYVTALSAYASGTPDGVAYWLEHCAEAVVAGAEEGVRIADAVLAGRLQQF
ncbi:hypothetical protein [Demetria terragena]|uniref:hypothetical protein n=1 Tax=Demetria terragena TaxID=63959 RepID=UPI00039B1543|nr:hypothetical protein [Demetria terragena]